ncbi:hypothetical protein SSS_02672 [Sarcoptes scabiei]|uniref:Uncharacterized protein n=1 Tax=Sarcoptes scabiei TaxID=52283 RepID=A0A834RDM7_SARSC|nr:hypothetical protein SSS_02672 [Sarcoptes scabiei]
MNVQIAILLIIVQSLMLMMREIGGDRNGSKLVTDEKCRRQQSNCTDNVYPYLNDPSYMFPNNLKQADQMCKMWSHFVDCIRRYINECFEDNRKILFQKSVENSIDTVHAICSSKLYQTGIEYLTKANCIRQISMDHCGSSYQLLTDNIANPSSKDEHICCPYEQFRQCVNKPLQEKCGRKAKNLMDHSMSFLISRCHHWTSRRITDCQQPIPTITNSIGKHTRASIQIDLDQKMRSNETIRSRSATETPIESLMKNEDRIESQNQSIDQNVRELDRDLNENNRIEFDHLDPEVIVYTLKPQSQIQSLYSRSIADAIILNTHLFFGTFLIVSIVYFR